MDSAFLIPVELLPADADLAPLLVRLVAEMDQVRAEMATLRRENLELRQRGGDEAAAAELVRHNGEITLGIPVASCVCRRQTGRAKAARIEGQRRTAGEKTIGLVC
jgi:hypothetical protein